MKITQNGEDKSIGIPVMPAVNKVEAIVPNIGMDLSKDQVKVLPGKFLSHNEIVLTCGNYTVYIYFFLI